MIAVPSAKASFMQKFLTLFGMVVSVLVALVFGLDAALEIPFGRPSWLMDIGMVVAAVLLLVASVLTYRELK